MQLDVLNLAKAKRCWMEKKSAMPATQREEKLLVSGSHLKVLSDVLFLASRR